MILQLRFAEFTVCEFECRKSNFDIPNLEKCVFMLQQDLAKFQKLGNLG